MIASATVGADVILTALSSALVEEDGRRAETEPLEMEPRVSLLHLELCKNSYLKL